MIPSNAMLAADQPTFALVAAKLRHLNVKSYADENTEREIRVRAAGTSTFVLEVETWFSDGCRECMHKTAKGGVFYVLWGTELLTTSGEYLPAQQLVPGIRLRSPSCKCGYEAVKSVTPKGTVEIPTFEVYGAENYGITDGKHVVLVRGNGDGE